MKLFRKRGKGNEEPAAWLVGLRSAIACKHREAADFLSRRTQYWNRGSWLIALGLFILLFGGCCFWLILKAFL
jgi:hypothetical protein